jgi:ADP-ribosylation factor-like protein 1
MGASVSWLSGLLFSKKEIRILILGLVCGANAGRPSLILHQKLTDSPQTG